MTSIHLGLGMALFAFAATTPAAVTQLAANGFLIRHEVTVNAPPGKVYDAIVNVGVWWNPAHTYSGDAANLSIDARAGGCFMDGGFEKMAPAVDGVLGEQVRRLKSFAERQ